MADLKEMLIVIDSTLQKISVRGDDVMLMAMARQQLKSVFDQIQNGGEVKHDGG